MHIIPALWSRGTRRLPISVASDVFPQTSVAVTSSENAVASALTGLPSKVSGLARKTGPSVVPVTRRSQILAAGGSRPALESFVAFRGREPTIDALLRHNGMAVA